jgi:hypothetical protein
MTTGAWIMLLVTWSIVIGITTRFFWKILRKPAQDQGDARRSSP